MNRIFKTKWSDSHKQYVVTDENHSNKGKTAKSAVTMAVSALMLVAGAASATYMEPGFKAQVLLRWVKRKHHGKRPNIRKIGACQH